MHNAQLRLRPDDKDAAALVLMILFQLFYWLVPKVAEILAKKIQSLFNDGRFFVGQ